jgi:serine phosphatase RsbU (regulator of sigma subunit)
VTRSPTSLARIAWICAAALTVFVLWLAFNSGAGSGIAFFYTLPAGLATWWFGWRTGALVALACCALYLLGAAINPVSSLPTALALRAFALAIVVVLVTLVRDRLTVLEHSAEELAAIRAALTPASLPALPEVDAGAAFAPSEYGVSGDFYLLTNGPDGSTVAIVGDVVGHGPAAARLATFIRARFAAFAANTSDPVEILTLANAALVERAGRGDELVSAVCMRFRPSDSMVSCAVAGHPLPLCLPSLEELRPDGETLLLGVGADLPLAAADIRLDSSDGVLIYTDGATDVRRDDELLGLEGFSRLLNPLTELPARELAREAHKAVLEWSDGPNPDDFCVLVLKPKGWSAA